MLNFMYSSAVFTALLDSQDLALSLASHSACFQKLGGHEGLNLSLRDIQLALVTSKYPEDKAFKLYERQGECYPALGNTDDPLYGILPKRAMMMIIW